MLVLVTMPLDFLIFCTFLFSCVPGNHGYAKHPTMPLDVAFAPQYILQYITIFAPQDCRKRCFTNSRGNACTYIVGIICRIRQPLSLQVCTGVVMARGGHLGI